MELRRNLTLELRELTQRSYLLALATVALLDLENSEIAANLPKAVNQLCSDGRVVPEESIEMSAQEVYRLKGTFASFTTDLLLVELQAIFHTHLMLAAGHTLEQPALQVESLLAKLWPRDKRSNNEWAYKEVILLTEVRNAVMHARGQIDRRNPRLGSRSYSDFLRFKRAIRTV